MKKLAVLLLPILIVASAFVLKVKEKKKPAGGSLVIAPSIALPESYNTFRVRMQFDDGTINPDSVEKWSGDLNVFDAGFSESNQNPDLLVELSVNQLSFSCFDSFDPSDPNAFIVKADLKGTLLVTGKEGDQLLNKKINYLFERPGGELSDQFKANELTVDFLLLRKIKKMNAEEACAEIKEKMKSSPLINTHDFYSGLVLQAKDTLTKYLSSQIIAVGGGFYGFKKMDELLVAAENAADAVNSLESISRKKRRPLSEVQSTLKETISVWKNALKQATSQEMKDYLNYNLAFAYLFLEMPEKSKHHSDKIKTEVSGFVRSGSFKDDISTLRNVLTTYSENQENITIRSLHQK